VAVSYSNTAEGGVAGDDVTTLNSGDVSGDAWSAVTTGTGGTITFDSAQKAHGALSYKLTLGATASSQRLDWFAGDTSQTSWSGRLYARFGAYPTATGHAFLRLFDTADNRAGGFGLTTSGQLQCYGSTSGNTAVGTVTSNAVPLNQWVRLAWTFTAGAGTAGSCNIWMWPSSIDDTADPGAANKATASGFASGAATSLATIAHGVFLAPIANASYWFDDIAVVSGTAKPGPTGGSISLVGASTGTSTSTGTLTGVSGIVALTGQSVGTSSSAGLLSVPGVGPLPSLTLLPGAGVLPGVAATGTGGGSGGSGSPDPPNTVPPPVVGGKRRTIAKVRPLDRKPPVELFAEVTDASGSKYRWAANERAGSRPQGLSFRTKLGEGFSDANLSLSRRVDLDYQDLDLVNDLSLYGLDGTTAYEGRIVSLPREVTDRHQVGVTVAGWISHMTDRTFSQVFIDRDTSRWGAPNLGRQLDLINQTRSFNKEIAWEADGGSIRLNMNTQGGAIGTPITNAEVWYKAPAGVKIAELFYKASQVGDFGFWERAVYATDNPGSGRTKIEDLRTNNVAHGVQIPNFQYVTIYADTANIALTPSAGQTIIVSKVGVVGDHALPTYTGDPNELPGYRVSDMLRYIVQQYCPLLNPSGITDTSYVVQHAAYIDPTSPYDAALDLNKYHLWNLAVWDNRRVVFAPTDTTDYVWEIRTDDPGVTFSPQGRSIDDLHNGVVVTYQDVLTGTQEILTPLEFGDLKDSDPDNIWNRQQIEHWKTVPLSTPTLREQALQIGRAVLGESNRPRQPGTITVRNHLRDRSGNWQQAWKVRAGDTIALTNFPSDNPRLIHETSWDDATKTLTISVDGPPDALDAINDRIINGLGPQGLAA
jgi:hypothetical protein